MNVREWAIHHGLLKPGVKTYPSTGDPSPNVSYDVPTLRLDHVAKKAIERQCGNGAP